MKLKPLSQSGIFILAILLFSACSKSGSNPTPQNNAPTIASLSTNTGPYNTSVTITGTGFSPTAANDKVFFNGKAATVIAASATEITATVPVGAGTGNVTVSVNGGVAISGPIFTYQLTSVVSTFVGSNQAGEVNGAGVLAILNAPTGITIDTSGNLYAPDDGGVVRKVTPKAQVTSYAGENYYDASLDGTVTSQQINFPSALTMDNNNTLYVTELSTNRILKITSSGTVTPFIEGVQSKGHFSPLSSLTGIAVDKMGNMFVVDQLNNLIIKVTPNGISSIFAGTGEVGSADGIGTSATFNNLQGITIDLSGNLYVSDYGNNLIRKITPDGTVSTFAGNINGGYSDGIGVNASFYIPGGLTTDKVGNVYVADTGNGLIRKITPSGTVTTIAGSRANRGAIVNGAASAAGFYKPTNLTIDASGDIYVTDGNEIRKITIQ